MVELLYAGLVGFQMCLVTGILVGHQVDGNSDCQDLFLQVIFYNLLPTASQFIQIQKTYGTNSFSLIYSP